MTMTHYTQYVADYVARTRYEHWSAEAVDKIKIHFFDTLLAMLSGSALPAGQAALAYLSEHGAVPRRPAAIIGTEKWATLETAAMINGMFAHADETDDTSETARMHPGASIIPAALAVADYQGSTGQAFINAVLVGYQVGVAFPQAVWADGRQRMHCARTTHNV